MGEVVNLRQARKQRTRRLAEQDAAKARAKHGRTKAERTATQTENQRAVRRLDGHKVERTDDPSAPQ